MLTQNCKISTSIKMKCELCYKHPVLRNKIQTDVYNLEDIEDILTCKGHWAHLWRSGSLGPSARCCMCHTARPDTAQPLWNNTITLYGAILKTHMNRWQWN